MSTPQPSEKAAAARTLPVPVSPGGTAAGMAHVESSYSEQITEIVGRLQRRYPEDRISRVDLESRVRGFYHQFDTVRIRSFVGVFVERLVRRSIGEPAVPAADGSVA